MSRRRPAILLLALLAPALARADLLPDLILSNNLSPSIITQTFPADHCAVDEGCTLPGTRRLLRFRTESRNIGNADLAIGSPVGNPLFHYHACHGHYHLQGFAEYRLLGPSGMVAAGYKSGFCLLDSLRWDPTANPQPHYNCNSQGISKGWGDVYGPGLDCQWIDITDVPPGHYTIELEVNPQHVLTESDYTNNTVQVGIDIPAVPTPTPTWTPVPTQTHAPLILDPIKSPIVVGGSLALSGSGFTAGSLVVLFVAMPTGVQAFGPYGPNPWTPSALAVQLPPNIPLGNGFGTVVVVNTDQGFAQSNAQSQLLFGAAAANIPTITAIGGTPVAPAEVGVPFAHIDTVVVPGAKLAISGTGFNAPLVVLYTPNSAIGPLAPLAGASSTALQVIVPSDVPVGPGAFQVVNNPFVGHVISNAVSVVLGAAVTIAGVQQSSSTVTVTGTGFTSFTVINLFNLQGMSVANLGGFNAMGQAQVPLAFDASTQFHFTVPAGAVTGPAYLQAINPPYTGFASSGGDPDGAFTISAP